MPDGSAKATPQKNREQAKKAIENPSFFFIISLLLV
jgi:hypothetical protein